MEELIKKLEDHLIADEDIFSLNIEKFKEYFKEFFQKYPGRDFSKLSDIAFGELFKSLVLLSNPYHTKKILEIFEKYKFILFDVRHMDMLRVLVLYLESEEFRKVMDDFSTDSVKAKINLLKSNKIIRKNNISLIAIVGFLGLLQEYPNFKKEVTDNINFELYLFDVAVGVYEALKKLKDDYQIYGPKKQNRIFNERIGIKSREELRVSTYMDIVHFGYNDILRDYSNQLRDDKRNNEKILELIDALRNKGEIKNIDALLKLCPESLKLKLVDCVLEHNNRYYRDLEEEYKALKLNSDENLELLFGKYNYAYKEFTSDLKSRLKAKGYNWLESILENLSNVGCFLSGEELLLVGLEEMRKVQKLIDQFIISREFVINNVELLFSGNDTLRVLMRNIDLLRINGINIIGYHNSMDVLLSENVEGNLEILKDYNINVTRKCQSILFLGDSNLVRKIDLLIEIGLFNDLDLNLLNLGLEEIYKMKMFNDLNIPIGSNIEFGDLEEFMVQIGNDLVPSSFSSNRIDSDLSLPKELEPFRVDSRILMIGDIYVSSNRVLRNLRKFGIDSSESIFYAIIYDSFYTLEEIMAIKEVLMPRDTDVVRS